MLHKVVNINQVSDQYDKNQYTIELKHDYQI